MLDSASKRGKEHFVYDFKLKLIVATSRESSRGAAGRASE